MILSDVNDLAKHSMIRSVARSPCDSWVFFCQSRQSEQVQNFYNQLSWVESDRAVWSREKLQPTSLMSLQYWVLRDVSLFVAASVVIFNLSAISWTAFLFASLIPYCCTISYKHDLSHHNSIISTSSDSENVMITLIWRHWRCMISRLI